MKQASEWSRALDLLLSMSGMGELPVLESSMSCMICGDTSLESDSISFNAALSACGTPLGQQLVLARRHLNTSSSDHSARCTVEALVFGPAFVERLSALTMLNNAYVLRSEMVLASLSKL